MTPIDTVREALERVREVWDSPAIMSARKSALVEARIEEGRDLLEAMEKHGRGDTVFNRFTWHDWTHTLAQSYARRVGEVCDG